MARSLLQAEVVAVVTAATSDYLGQPWGWDEFVDLSDRASHPCGIFRSRRLSVFAKLGTGPRGKAVFEAELKGLALLRSVAGAPTPTPLGTDPFIVDEDTVLLLSEEVAGRHGTRRTSDDWRAMGRALAGIHRNRGDHFGLDQFDGFFGPLPQSNRPTAAARWTDFYAERRLGPRLRDAVDSGHLPPTLVPGVERIIGRLPEWSGPEPPPMLLHGDPQQNNIISTDAGAVVLDPAPYYGHPEADLALVDFFEPVPDALFDGYRDEMPIDAGFASRRALWRLHAHLAGVSVGGAFGRLCVARVSDAVDAYR